VPILNGHALSRQALQPYPLPIGANMPCRAVPPAEPVAVAVNGHALCLFKAYRETLPGGPNYTVLDQVGGGPGDDFPTATVPADHVFMMGDNRDDSLDSRFSPIEGGIGMVPADHLIGRALVTFWSTDGSASWWKPWTWFSALRATRIGNNYSGAAE
jgi:signal peptidase I